MKPRIIDWLYKASETTSWAAWALVAAVLAWVLTKIYQAIEHVIDGWIARYQNRVDHAYQAEDRARARMEMLENRQDTLESENDELEEELEVVRAENAKLRERVDRLEGVEEEADERETTLVDQLLDIMVRAQARYYSMTAYISNLNAQLEKRTDLEPSEIDGYEEWDSDPFLTPEEGTDGDI